MTDFNVLSPHAILAYLAANGISTSSSPAGSDTATIGGHLGNDAGTQVVKPANANTKGWVLVNSSAENGGVPSDGWVSPVSPATNADHYLEPGARLTSKYKGNIFGYPLATMFKWFEEA